MGAPSAKRVGENELMSTVLPRPSTNSSDITRPTAGEILKLMPEKPAQTYNPLTPRFHPAADANPAPCHRPPWLLACLPHSRAREPAARATREFRPSRDARTLRPH